MSCMIMRQEPLAALANAVETRLNCDYSYWGFDAPDSLRRELRDCRSVHDYFVSGIYRRLYALNVRAYNGCCCEHEEAFDEAAAPDVDFTRYVIHNRPEYQGSYFAVCAWHYQLAQLLDFWLYQTAEDTTRDDPLRLAMRDFRDGLYCFIIQNNPQYTTGLWGKLPCAGIAAANKLRYQVITYDHSSGADDKKDYQTVKEAERAAWGYMRGTTPLSDGLRYDGAIVYDKKKGRIIRQYGYFPDHARPVRKPR